MKLIELNRHDLSLAYPIGHAFLKEAGRRPFNEESFYQFWRFLLENNIGKIYGLVEYDTDAKAFRAIGLLGATFSPDPYTGCKAAAEQFWYVTPEHRKSGVGLQLLDQFEKDAKESNCEELVMCHFLHMGAGLERVFEARGYYAFEKIYKKDL